MVEIILTSTEVESVLKKALESELGVTLKLSHWENYNRGLGIIFDIEEDEEK